MSRIEEPKPGGFQSASEYSRTTEDRRRALDLSKASRRPLGGAPPIPPGKMSGIMPQPSFDEAPSTGSDWSPEPQEPPPPSPRMGGVGSGFAVNQAMAHGQLDRPVSLGEAAAMGKKTPAPVERKGLSKDSVALLEMQQAQRQELPEADNSRRQRLDESEREIADENKVDMDMSSLDAIANMRADLIYNDVRRKKIEEGLEPLDIADLVTHREIQQIIPVVPGKLSYTMRTLNEQENLWCLQYVYEFPGSARYVEELFNMARIVCGLVSLNGKMLPDHRKAVGTLAEEVVREQFKKKFQIVTLYPISLIADIGAQFQWFQDRVNKLFSVTTLKNG